MAGFEKETVCPVCAGCAREGESCHFEDCDAWREWFGRRWRQTQALFGVGGEVGDEVDDGVDDDDVFARR